MKVVFFGSGAFGLPTLERLTREHSVQAVVTQPDRPAGRNRKPTATEVGAWAAEHAPVVPVLKPEDVNEPGVAAAVRGVEADAWVVIAFGQKLSRGLLEGVFAINLHASLLPRWRGAAPINHAILAGDEETGNSVITLADRMDAGLVLGQSRRRIDPSMTAGDLHDLLAADGAPLVLEVLDQKSRDALRPVEQAESGVTLARKLRKADGWVDFTRPAAECVRRVHGLNPWPGVTVGFRGQELRLLRAEAGRAGSEQEGMEPGSSVEPGRGVVACGAGTAMTLLEVQPAGKRAMAWREFANGAKPERGELLIGGARC